MDVIDVNVRAMLTSAHIFGNYLAQQGWKDVAWKPINGLGSSVRLIESMWDHTTRSVYRQAPLAEWC